VSFAV
jgi:AP-1 complex subunit beta-1